jgi:S-adenosylmethionine decarboxylase
VTTFLGRHLIAELCGCRPETLDDVAAVERHMLAAIELSGATLVKAFFHRFPPNGISGIVVVAESHFSIHTWPEIGYAAVDIFTCGPATDPRAALDYLRRAFGAETSYVRELKRGPAAIKQEP